MTRENREGESILDILREVREKPSTYDKIDRCTRAIRETDNKGLVDCLSRKIDRLNGIDSLTGLPNGERFESEAKANMDVYEGDESDYLLYLDFDDVKKVNDRYGHDYGDSVLEKIGEVLRENTRKPEEEERKYDLVGRVGGDEFNLILSEVRDDSIQDVVQRLEKVLYNALKSKGLPNLRFSLGVARYSNRGEEGFDNARSRADRAMYYAKEKGQTEIYNPKKEKEYQEIMGNNEGRGGRGKRREPEGQTYLF